MRKAALRLVCLTLSCGLPAIAANGVLAQSYPAKPIRIVLPYTPGGANDIRIRIIADKLTQSLGQQVFVENRPGADGAIGMEMVARSAPDGYTLINTVQGALVVNPALFKKVRYDPLNDFEHITQLITTTTVMVVNPSLQVTSVKELVELAKAKPGQLNYATAVSSYYLFSEMFKFRAGVDMVYIPFKGSVPALTSLMSGETQMMFNPILAVLPHIKSHRVKAIAVGSPARSPVLPDVPTIAETYPGFHVNTWAGVAAPAGTPKEIVKKLHAEIVKVLHIPAVKERLEAGGDTIVGSAPEEVTALIKAEFVTFKNVIKEARIPLIDQ